MNLPSQKPTLQFIYTNEFGDKTEVKKDLDGVAIDSLFYAIRESVLACGFGQSTVDEYFPKE